MNTCFWLSSVFFFFFANERYKHINLLNIFISATLFCFWVHATVSFFSSFSQMSLGATVLLCAEDERSGKSGLEKETSKLKRMWSPWHDITKHKDVKDVTRHRIKFLIVWFCGVGQKPPHWLLVPLDPCVLILSMSTRSPLFPCGVQRWDWPIQSICKESWRRFNSHWGDICTSFELKKR